MSDAAQEIKRLRGALRAWNVWARGLLGEDDNTGLREGRLREALGNAHALARRGIPPRRVNEYRDSHETCPFCFGDGIVLSRTKREREHREHFPKTGEA